MRKTSLEEFKIQKLIESYLRFQMATADSQPHLDEDFLNSFVEGRLSRPEALPILNHLSKCSFCLHITAELARLEYGFSDEKIPAAVAAAHKPEKISEVLSNLFSKIFGASDGAVFAHQENRENKEESENKE